MLVNVNGSGNNNKFYRLELHDDGTIVKNWGRVGADGQRQSVRGTRAQFESIINQKRSRGYSEVETVNRPAASGGGAHLRSTAQNALAAGDPALAKLVDQLVAANRHQIGEASGGMITVSVDGQVTTPLGAIGESAIVRARITLSELAAAKSDAERIALTERYLRLVPQKVPARGGWASTWITKLTTVSKQEELLDALEQTLRYAKSQADGSADGDQQQSDLFRYRIAVVEESSAEFTEIVQHYDRTKQDVHAWSKKRPVRVYRLTDARCGDVVEQVQKRVRNVRRLWHGTGVANVLSILSQGLYVPPVRGTTIQTAGRMFGDGVYLSESASKSLGYSVGYWHGTRSSSAFMLLTDTAMGSEYRPASRNWDSGVAKRARTELNKFGNHYDSINVKAGTCGVRNHEAIVWDPNQVQLKYLVEFE